MSQPILLPAATMALAVSLVVAIRSRSIRTRLATETVLMCLIGGVLLVEDASPLFVAAKAMRRPAGAWVQALAVMWWLVAASLVATAAAAFRDRDARTRQARLFSDLVSAGIYASAAFVVANSILDLPVRALFATSGVIAIVLGLALQSSLSDLFSGIAVGVEQPFGIGDHVGVDDDVEGWVIEMNWRAVRFETADGDVVVVPNSVVAKSRLVNRDRPTRHRTTTVRIRLRTSAPAERIINRLREALLLCPQVATDPRPEILIDQVDLQTVTFAINFNVADGGRLRSTRGEVLRQTRRVLRFAGVGFGGHRDVGDLIRDVALFDRLSPEQTDALRSRLRSTTLLAGSILFEQGSIGDEFYIVTAGVLDVAHAEGAGRRSVGRIGPGGYFGVVSLMTDAPRQASVKALTDSDLLTLSKQDLIEMLHADPSLRAVIERSMSQFTDMLVGAAADSIDLPLPHGGITGFLERWIGGHTGRAS